MREREGGERVCVCVTGFLVESGTRDETGRFRDIKRCAATGD